MKTFFIISALAVAMLLGCTTPTSNTPGGTSATPAKITHVSATVKGLYLTGGTTSSRSVMGRSIVTGSGAALGGILPSGVPTILTFQDAQNNTVTATVTQAQQITPDYVLLSYTIGTVSTTAALKMSSGAVASLDVVPDNWAGIVAKGSTAWYEAGGSIVSASLDTGTATTLSTGAAIYQTSGVYLQDNLPMGTTGAWDSSALIYVDAGGVVYVADCTNSQNVRGVAVAANGNQTNIGTSYGTYVLGGILSISGGPFVTDPATGTAWYATGRGLWNDNPMAIGGSLQTGYCFQAFPITFSASGVTTWDNVLPQSGVTLFNMAYGHNQSMTRLGYGVGADTAMWSDGVRAITMTFSAGVPTLTSVDISTVPAVMPKDQQGDYTGQVTNFKYVGGKLYYGPATSQTIGVVDASGAPHDLATASGTMAGWAVVGGVLFFSDGAGNWQAPISGNTLGAVTAYTGAVTGVTN